MPRSKAPFSLQPSAISRPAAAFAALALVVIAGYLSAGPLDPPAGAVAGTGKTLAQAEPRTPVNAASTPGDADSLFKITQPGSYYLTGNITGVAGKHGIKISPSQGGGITIDLNGFEILGVGGNGGVFSGVNVTGSATCITVVNGTVRGWGGGGINFVTPGAAKNCRLSGVSAVNNVGIGIVAPVASNVSGCSAYGNAGGGISVNFACTVSNCRSASNGGAGIATLSCCTVTGCSSSNNSIGVNLGSNSRVTGCTTRGNADGIRTSFGSTVSGNTSIYNFQNGVNITSNDTRIEGNSCAGGLTGIRIGSSGNYIIKNTCTDCSGSTWIIVANNAFGTIWDSTGNANPPVSGFSGGGGSTPDANANYTH